MPFKIRTSESTFLLSISLSHFTSCRALCLFRQLSINLSPVHQLQSFLYESIEVNPVPASISNEEVEDNICKALPLTGHEVIPNDLQAYHCLKKKGDFDCEI